MHTRILIQKNENIKERKWSLSVTIQAFDFTGIVFLHPLHMIFRTVLTKRVNPQQVKEQDQSSLIIVHSEDAIACWVQSMRFLAQYQ